MKRLVLAVRPCFAKYKEANPNLGGLDDPPDLKNKELDKINYKTVLAAIKGSHPQIIKAKFVRTEGDVHKLIITVAY